MKAVSTGKVEVGLLSCSPLFAMKHELPQLPRGRVSSSTDLLGFLTDTDTNESLFEQWELVLFARGTKSYS